MMLRKGKPLYSARWNVLHVWASGSNEMARHGVFCIGVIRKFFTRPLRFSRLRSTNSWNQLIVTLANAPKYPFTIFPIRLDKFCQLLKGIYCPVLVDVYVCHLVPWNLAIAVSASRALRRAYRNDVDFGTAPAARPQQLFVSHIIAIILHLRCLSQHLILHVTREGHRFHWEGLKI